MDATPYILVVILGTAVLGIILFFVQQAKESKLESTMTEEELRTRRDAKEAAWEERKARLQNGELNPALICPHCLTKGQVRVKAIKHKAGISGGKATAAVLTAGVSMLATGLSRKEDMTQAKCGNCRSTWRF